MEPSIRPQTWKPPPAMASERIEDAWYWDWDAKIAGTSKDHEDRPGTLIGGRRQYLPLLPHCSRKYVCPELADAIAGTQQFRIAGPQQGSMVWIIDSSGSYPQECMPTVIPAEDVLEPHIRIYRN